jgi:hypothetical protein
MTCQGGARQFDQIGVAAGVVAMTVGIHYQHHLVLADSGPQRAVHFARVDHKRLSPILDYVAVHNERGEFYRADFHGQFSWLP